MDPHKMTLQELGKYFYGRNVEFTLKNGQKKKIFVQDIMNENDDEPEITFLGDSVTNEIGISEILSAHVIENNI